MSLAIIPARGGSKRIPRKNIRPFAGVPMIGHAIGAARASGLFERVVVSTDDDEIAAVARSLGADVPFLRPADLADDHTPTVPVIAHAIAACRALGWNADVACCIYPGVPCLEAQDLREARAELERGATYAFPVTPFPSAVQRALLRAGDGSTRPMFPEFAATRTQDLPPAFHDAGQFYWGRAEAWLAGLNIHLHGRTIVIPSWRVVDIDTPEDWERAERLHQALWRERGR
jgi:pseudaminic acid cytidylyltransferase